MKRRWLYASAVVLLAAASCIAGAPQGIQRETAGGGSGGIDFGTTNDASSVSTGPTTNDPHAVLGADPGHGPFVGGQRVIVSGKGFKPEVRVWFGDVEASEVIAIDPTHIQVNAPPGDPGAVELTTQNGDDASTRRSLPGGYTYEALYAEPDTGPVAGGTVISIFGKDTSWDEDVLDARIDGRSCTALDVIAADELRCTVPKGTPGTKSISVETATGTASALDAYTYQDSSDGFKGGLGGAPLAGQLKVLVYDNFSGDPLTGAHVIVGSDLSTGLYQQADSSGVALFSDPSLAQPITVTVAAECHSPISFVDVPVDTVTAYLNPVLTPQCASGGDPPPSGGSPVLSGAVSGELVWPSQQEFQKGAWSNVPAPDSQHEQRIAYLFFAGRNPQANFTIPSSLYAVDETSPGDRGYGFSIPGFPGNQTLYAIAGIQNTLTGKFYGYAFGSVKGVGVVPGEVTEAVYVAMDFALDQALVMHASPPPSGPKGPDRLHASVAVEIAQNRYAILPGMQKNPLLPLGGALTFVGLPPLDGALTGARYISSAEAVSGPSLGAPLSAVGSVATTTSSVAVTIDGFVPVAQLVDPPIGGAWDGKHLAVSYPTGGFPPDLTVYEILSGNGLVRWVVAVPRASHAVELPDLSAFVDAGMPPGPLTIGVYGARIEDFDYGQIGYVNLRPQGMDAYSLDFFNAHL